ncbi:MAG: hypothetical protein J0L75_06430, partial [Spirochaetes bacterium]|nr:hypothetical protein [Spirochaetota bacterium]
MRPDRLRRLLFAWAFAALPLAGASYGGLFDAADAPGADPLHLRFTHASETGGVHAERLGVLGASGRPWLPSYAFEYEFTHLRFDAEDESPFLWRSHRLTARLQPFQWGPWGLEAAGSGWFQSGDLFRPAAQWNAGARTRLQFPNWGFALALETDPLLAFGTRALPSLEAWGHWKDRLGFSGRLAYQPTPTPDGFWTSLAWKLGANLTLAREYTPFLELSGLGNALEIALGLDYRARHLAPLAPIVGLRVAVDLLSALRVEVSVGFATGAKAAPATNGAAAPAPPTAPRG